MSRTKKYNKKSRTKKNNKKYRNFRKKTLSGGMDCNYNDCNYVKKLREKTRINRDSAPGRPRINRTINPNGPSSYYVAQQVEPPPPNWKDNGYITDNKYESNKKGLYAGPSIKYGTMGTAIPHGKDGKFLYKNGDVYTGDFFKGKREGTGKLTLKEGPTYEGDWKDDKFVPFTDWKNDIVKRPEI